MQGFAGRVRAFTLLIALMCAAGCASNRGPEVVTITASEYQLAFDSAMNAVREVGMPAELIDRRTGILETEYRNAGTMFEPWRSDSTTASSAFESTINHERRKVRIEFTPVQFTDQPGADELLTGPDFTGERIGVADLTTYDGRIEIRALVQLERSTVVGRRRGDWTRRSTTVTRDPDSGLDRSQTFWTPIARDEALERRLLREIEKAIAGAGRDQDAGDGANARETPS